MDIEPLWAIGGWFSLSYCMAEPKSSSPISEPCSKPPSFLHFLTLFFILLLLVNLSHQPHPSTMASSETTKASESTMSTTAMHSQNSHKSRTPSSKDAARREFGAEAHEVPSGPNPISN